MAWLFIFLPFLSLLPSTLSQVCPHFLSWHCSKSSFQFPTSHVFVLLITEGWPTKPRHARRNALNCWTPSTMCYRTSNLLMFKNIFLWTPTRYKALLFSFFSELWWQYWGVASDHHVRPYYPEKWVTTFINSHSKFNEPLLCSVR